MQKKRPCELLREDGLGVSKVEFKTLLSAKDGEVTRSLFQFSHLLNGDSII